MPLSNPVTATSDPYLRVLRSALKQAFASSSVIASTDSSDVALNAQVMPLYTSVATMFQQHIRKDVIRQSIAQIDASWDDTGKISALQTQLLALPQWTTDTSDQP